MGQSKIESFEKIHRWTFEIIQKFGQKMKKFENVYTDTCAIVNHIKKNFKIFHFLAKFFNYLKGPQIEYFKIMFFKLRNAQLSFRKFNLFWSLKLGFHYTSR